MRCARSNKEPHTARKGTTTVRPWRTLSPLEAGSLVCLYMVGDSICVGTRSQTRQAELEAAEATGAQAARAVWPEQPDRTMEIQRMTHDLHLRDRQTSRHFQRNSKNSPSIQYRREPERSPTSSGRHTQPSTGCLLHSTPARWWWRCGGINPREHGYSGDDPQSGPIFSGTATRGPSLFGHTLDAPQGIFHDPPDTHWHVRPLSSSSTVGRDNARSR